VASCKLPFGNPNRNTCFDFIFLAPARNWLNRLNQLKRLNQLHCRKPIVQQIQAGVRA
jgi:hypothetical protein